jgi:F0F1-type ATP synthase membrane subunit c/vacuolar-type H+-ATPase subunit K
MEPILPADVSLVGLIMAGGAIGGILGATVDVVLQTPRYRADRLNRWMVFGAGLGVIAYLINLRFGVSF